MAYKYQTPSKLGIDCRKARKCVSLITGQIVTRNSLRAAPAKNLRKQKATKH